MCVCVCVCHPSRPLFDAIWLNRCRRKPCPSVNSQNIAISLVIRYYRCRDLETCLMLNQKSLISHAIVIRLVVQNTRQCLFRLL